MKPQVSVGPSSILGWLSFAGLTITSVVNSLEHNQALLTGQNKAAGVAALIALVATNAGRHLQATFASGAEEEPESSFQPPDSSVTPDAPVPPAVG